jgi:hypothetical protein
MERSFERRRGGTSNYHLFETIVKNPTEAHLADQTVVGSLEPEMSATSVATGLSKTRATRKATGAISQPIGVKARSPKNVKDKISRRKHKGRRK